MFVVGVVVRGVVFAGATVMGSDCDGAAYLELARHLAAGQGYVTNAAYHLWNATTHFPRPESLWNPLFPYLVAGATWFTHDVWNAGKLVSLLFGTLTPPLAALLGRALTGRWAVGAVTGLFTALDPGLVSLSSRVLTEGVTTTLVTLALVLAFRRERWASWSLGVVLGLAYLQKYQSALLWLAVVPIVISQSGRSAAVRRLAIAAACFALVILPWLVRNALVFGNPFYSDIRWNLLSAYPAFGTQERYWAMPVRAPDFTSYALGHPREVLARARWLVPGIVRSWSDHYLVSLAVLPLCVAGLALARSKGAAWLGIAAYAFLLAVLSAITIPEGRFLVNLLPPFYVLAACGVIAALELARPGSAIRWAAGFLAVGLATWVIVAEARRDAMLVSDRTSAWNHHDYMCPLEYRAIATVLASLGNDRSPVLAVETSHAALFLDRPVLRMPYSEAVVGDLVRRFGARYLVTTARDEALRLPAWQTRPPAWAHEIARESPDHYAPEAVAAGYGFLSPIIVYRLDPPR